MKDVRNMDEEKMIRRLERAWDTLEDSPTELLSGERSAMKCPNCGGNVLTHKVRFGGFRRVEWECPSCGWKNFQVI